VPVVIQPDLRVSATSLSISLSIYGGEKGIINILVNKLSVK
jgi:hypothetical protein